MGISGLLSLLKSIQQPCSLQKFNGLTIGVDAYVWLHRGTVACAIDLALGKPTAKFVEFAMNRVRMLIHFGITPYLVFDGDYLPSKRVTEEDRAKRREESRRFGLQLYQAGKFAQAQAELQKAVDVTPEMAGQLIEELRKHNIKFVVAPYEADAQLAYMERKGVIQGIISEDSDLLVFGARRLLTKLDQYGDCIEINRDRFTACKGISLVGWTDADFRRMAILSGCDYLPNVNRLGLKTAYSLVRKFQSTERIVQRLRFDARYTVPTDYLESFRKAELTFLHQWVFCSETKELAMGTPLEHSDLGDLSFLGKNVDPEIARGVAAGRLHPTTKEPLAVKSIPLRNPQSPWAAARGAVLSTPSVKVGKPIDQYFKARRVPLAELDPNTFTPSPRQMQLQENAARSFPSSPVPHNLMGSTPSLRRSPPATPLGATLTPQLSRNNPPKRPRLCDDGDDSIDHLHASEPTTSRFFSPSSRPAFLPSKASRRGKNHSIDIWSDDSIDEALAKLPDPVSQRIAKQQIYRDDQGGKESEEVVRPSRLKLGRKTSVFTESTSSDITSTQATNTSLLQSARSSQGEEREKTQIPEKLLGLINAGATPTEEIKHKKDPLKSITPCEEKSHVPQSPETNRTETCGVNSSISAFVPMSPTRPSAPICGSEDLLVPQSDSESETTNSNSDGRMSTTSKLNLSRFLFEG